MTTNSTLERLQALRLEQRRAGHSRLLATEEQRGAADERLTRAEQALASARDARLEVSAAERERLDAGLARAADLSRGATFEEAQRGAAAELLSRANRARGEAAEAAREEQDSRSALAQRHEQLEVTSRHLTKSQARARRAACERAEENAVEDLAAHRRGRGA